MLQHISVRLLLLHRRRRVNRSRAETGSDACLKLPHARNVCSTVRNCIGHCLQAGAAS